jgi:hypothetical protein
MKIPAIAFCAAILALASCQREVRETQGYPQGRITVYSTGDNREPFDSADRIIFYATYEYDARGKLVYSATYNQPGPDGEWKTDDDAMKSFIRSVNDPATGIEIRGEYYKPGTNEMTGWFENVFDTNGARVREITHPNSGANGVWFDADDGIGGWSKFVYEDGKLATAWFYDGAGRDGKWFTGDDTLLSFTSYFFDPKTDDLSFSITFRGAGPDGEYLTDDDPVSHYAIYENYRM